MNIFVELFPRELANIILRYSDDSLIIDLQNYFPELLKNIVIFNKNIYELFI